MQKRLLSAQFHYNIYHKKNININFQHVNYLSICRGKQKLRGIVSYNSSLVELKVRLVVNQLPYFRRSFPCTEMTMIPPLFV